MSGVNVKSEIKPLKKVLLHRPGKELLNLTPNTLEELLFDDIPFLKVAQEEHDAFAQEMCIRDRVRGVLRRARACGNVRHGRRPRAAARPHGSSLAARSSRTPRAPRVLSPGPAGAPPRPVSYTHLDVYKRQELGPTRR